MTTFVPVTRNIDIIEVASQLYLNGDYINIFVGGTRPVILKELKKLGITHVISLVRLSQEEKEAISSEKMNSILELKIVDLPSTNLVQHFPLINQTIKQVLDQPGQKVYVHCESGYSRSITCVAAYLCKTYGMNVQAAFDLLEMCRGCIQPNPGFQEQLEFYHSTLGCKDQDLHSNPNYLNMAIELNMKPPHKCPPYLHGPGRYTLSTRPATFELEDGRTVVCSGCRYVEE